MHQSLPAEWAEMTGALNKGGAYSREASLKESKDNNRTENLFCAQNIKEQKNKIVLNGSEIHSLTLTSL